MPAYYLLDVHEVTNPDEMARYRKRVHATVKQFGGRYLTVGGDVSVVEGDWRPAYPVLIEFPTARHARDWYDSSEYQPLKAQRLGATRGSAILLDAVPWEGD